MRTFEISISVGDLACSMKVDAPGCNQVAAEAFATKAVKLCAMLWGVDNVKATLTVADVDRKLDLVKDVSWGPDYGDPCEGRR